MHAAISAAKKQGVAVGAHPSFFDRENFGRKELTIPAEEVFDAVGISTWNFSSDRLRTGCATESREAARRAV